MMLLVAMVILDFEWMSIIVYLKDMLMFHNFLWNSEMTLFLSMVVSGKTEKLLITLPPLPLLHPNSKFRWNRRKILWKPFACHCGISFLLAIWILHSVNVCLFIEVQSNPLFFGDFFVLSMVRLFDYFNLTMNTCWKCRQSKTDSMVTTCLPLKH